MLCWVNKGKLHRTAKKGLSAQKVGGAKVGELGKAVGGHPWEKSHRKNARGRGDVDKVTLQDQGGKNAFSKQQAPEKAPKQGVERGGRGGVKNSSAGNKKSGGGDIRKHFLGSVGKSNGTHKKTSGWSAREGAGKQKIQRN